jgi:hypothetical protein
MGAFQVGYSINKKSMFRLKQAKIDIGAYGMTFNKRSHYIFRTANDTDGFFIRKNNWFNLLKNEIQD